jgi:hypothetical protein
VVGLAVGVACGTPETVQVPANTCPDHPCAAYTQNTPPAICNGGACVVSETFTNAVLVLSLPGNSYFAPDRTIAVPFPLPSLPCGTSTCTQLSDVTPISGAYVVLPHVQADLLHYALNPNNAETTLPVHVTYRALWPSMSTSENDDAVAAGLPLEPLEVDSIANVNFSSFPAPAGGNSQSFQTYLPPGNYQRTITPVSPFDAVFPPDVAIVTVGKPGGLELDSMNVDATSETGTPTPQVPTFTLTRDLGDMAGWTAYLRDQTTKRVLSSVVTLAGSPAANVVLSTNHHSGDALTNAELVIAPPPGSYLPTEIFAPQPTVLAQNETYPAFAVPHAPLTVAGTVSAPDGTPVEADLVFEATAIDTGRSCPFNTTNFEYVGRASARLDGGASTYALTLPQGEYRVSIRPLDPSADSPSAPVPPPPYAVTAIDSFIVGGKSACVTPASPGALVVHSTQFVEGSAFVTDGRPLGAATVDVVPVQCSDGSAASACLPRERETTTQDDGTFGLWLDPGTYRARVRPSQGSRLPWVWLPRAVTVGAAAMAPLQFAVPAPVYAGLTLRDPQGNPIVNAIVRVFELSDPTGWVETGRAITDATGHYDMYLAPASY